MGISNIDKIPNKYIDDPDFQTPLKTILIGDAIGCDKFYVNMDFVKPGGKSTKYHFHSQQEEFFMIMSGSGLLRMNGEEVQIGKGDVISKPAGKEIAHQFINNGSEILQILDVGTREANDIVTYPDENVLLVKNRKLVFNLNDHIENWSSGPV
ncbi:cupin domain-containing protein [Caproiciproducens sp.]|uniref:cupin domain-containing protein n=1 Tax=Caproiciproducens sp. TaxID=1954376 RepID=UPI0028963EEC|nr:cupin domain-containing protein [Caproiciproducens sp.]